MRALLLIGLLMLIPAATACSQVTPIVGLEFDGKQPCMFTYEGTYDGCEELPAVGESRTYEGRVRWNWDVDQCSSTGGVLQGDMFFEFSSSALSPKWLPVTFEPATITVPLNEYYDPTSLDVDSTQNRIYSEQTRDVAVTFTMERQPTAGELEELRQRDHAARVFLKVLAQGTGSSDAFGITQFVFDTSDLAATEEVIEHPPDQQVPALPVTILLGIVLVAALRRR